MKVLAEGLVKKRRSNMRAFEGREGKERLIKPNRHRPGVNYPHEGG